MVQEHTAKTIEFFCRRLYAVGYAGRAQEAVLAHIHELEQELGVPAPKHIPTVYPCGSYLLTQEERLCIAGAKTCGEVEPVLLLRDGEIYVALGSDHTDRTLECTDVLYAKQICPKPISHVLWNYSEVKDHWDEIQMRSYQVIDGVERLYQSGTLKSILPIERILEVLRERDYDLANAAVFCGTIPLAGGFSYGQVFRAELVDNMLDRRIELRYGLEVAQRDE